MRLADGTEVEAKYAVLTDVDPYQLCVELIGEEYLSHEIIRKIKRLEMDWITISWYTFALHERPCYIAENFDPDVYKCCSIALGRKSWEDFMKDVRRRRMEMWPDPDNFHLFICDHSYLPEAGTAPPGKACVLARQWVLPAYAYSEQEWKELEKRHADELLNWWQKFAPNMTWDNVIGYLPVTPFYTSRHARNWGPAGNWAVIDMGPNQLGRWRPIPEWAGHRIRPIEKLYATGAGWHPGGVWPDRDPDCAPAASANAQDAREGPGAHRRVGSRGRSKDLAK